LDKQRNEPNTARGKREKSRRAKEKEEEEKKNIELRTKHIENIMKIS
jgi:hypothetical protein